ncbi:MAG: pyruvate, phosphate dikinase [Prolixibacteraceae bacterium]|nr:pyruvate, phosphate dikinase [Prolixibacteraceae bacterium]
MDLEQITIPNLYKRKKSDRDIFQELMPTKVKEVLLVATLYDSYSIVREGQFSDKIRGEYLQLNLYAAPRFTSVNSQEEALLILEHMDFDIIIIMAGLDKDMPVQIARDIYKERPDIPLLLLVNNNADLRYFQIEGQKLNFVDRVFVWNGNSNVFIAMIKYIEDKKNIARDTQNGNVRVILLIEDSIQYYSRYLPILYTTIMTQTQVLVHDEAEDDLHKILKMRARPKVILVSTYEDAVHIINAYNEYLLCVISDVKFEKDGKDDDDAGVELLKYVKKRVKYPIPIMLQSHDISNAQRAREIKAEFINKNSESLSQDIFHFMFKRLGFGNFVFKDSSGTPVMEASNLKEFQEKFKLIPDSVVEYHSRRNSFSTWLMARGEINMAKQLIPMKFEDFETTQELKERCLNVFEKEKLEKLRGRIINFNPELVSSNRFITRLAKGSLGGKGRGIAFISNFIENIDFQKILPGINIRIPATAIIGALEYDKFLEINNLFEDVHNHQDFELIKNLFLQGELDEELGKNLWTYLENVYKPLAVRSSGLFEDSLLQPFSGVYSTFLIPNNHPDIHERFKHLITAIKLVYASIYTESAQSYFDAVNYKIEEEKMAVVIQEVVGHEYNGKYYPHISGVAQSYNFYPVSYMEPEDGFSVAAVGLGIYVVGGESAYRFCPKYPAINPTDVKDQIRDSQKFFYSLDMQQNNFDLAIEGEDAAIKKISIREAEKDGTIENSVSTYDMENDALIPGCYSGPKVVDFANILKYNTMPLSDTLQVLLKLFRDAMGSPVEIEYAIDMEPGEKGWPTFYLLQIKPLIRIEDHANIDIDAASHENLLMYAERGMGNGQVKEITDVIFVDPDTFDRIKTKEIAYDINYFNKQMEEEGREYILLGPGRWGSRDHFTGIPVLWAHISKARIIIEMGLKDFPLDGSLGSHFFHNVTSMNVGYFSVPYNARNAAVDIEILCKQEVIKETEFIKHVRFKEPLTILMNGRQRKGLITY